DVGQLLLVELTDGGGVRAAHVVGLDLEVGQRRRLCGLREQQVTVRLVRVRALRLREDLDESAEDGLRLVVETALVAQVAGGVRYAVLLAGEVVEVLPALAEVQAEHVAARARSLERSVEVYARDIAAQVHHERIQAGVP